MGDVLKQISEYGDYHNIEIPGGRFKSKWSKQLSDQQYREIETLAIPMVSRQRIEFLKKRHEQLYAVVLSGQRNWVYRDGEEIGALSSWEAGMM